MDFHGFRGMDAYSLKERPAAPIETFARFQAGFLSSEGFHRIPCKLAICQIWDALPNPGIPK